MAKKRRKKKEEKKKKRLWKQKMPNHQMIHNKKKFVSRLDRPNNNLDPSPYACVNAS